MEGMVYLCAEKQGQGTLSHQHTEKNAARITDCPDVGNHLNLKYVTKACGKPSWYPESLPC